MKHRPNTTLTIVLLDTRINGIALRQGLHTYFLDEVKEDKRAMAEAIYEQARQNGGPHPTLYEITHIPASGAPWQTPMLYEEFKDRIKEARVEARAIELNASQRKLQAASRPENTIYSSPSTPAAQMILFEAVCTFHSRTIFLWVGPKTPWNRLATLFTILDGHLLVAIGM